MTLTSSPFGIPSSTYDKLSPAFQCVVDRFLQHKSEQADLSVDRYLRVIIPYTLILTTNQVCLPSVEACCSTGSTVRTGWVHQSSAYDSLKDATLTSWTNGTTWRKV
jgi:hypothetical protein